jgi:hypothetical protein
MTPIKVNSDDITHFFVFMCFAVVSGCPYKDRNDPGNLQFDWLEVQLDMYRKEGLQVRMLTFSVINNDPDVDIEVWIIGRSFLTLEQDSYG